MTAQFRHARFRQGVALLALVSSLWGAWLVVVHGSLGDDPVCAAESGLPIAHHQTSIRQGPGRISAQHCFICHWLRSLRSVSGDAQPSMPSVAPDGFVSPDPITHEGRIALVHRPARSPPA
jgi:hypothetical protein